ncbi:MAG: hypothetical protein WB902_33200, partial [Acetobacteraceae bacterium]
TGNATCTAGTYTDIVPQPPGSFPAPINYNQPTPNTPLNVTLNSGVIVTLSNPGVAVNLNNFGGGAAAGAVLLSANGAAVRTFVTTNESDCAPAPCGDLTRIGGIPGKALRQYAGRHDRHASDSAKMGVRRLEAR